MSRDEIVIHTDHPDAETVCTDVARTAAEQLDDGHPFEVTLFPIGTDGHSGDAIAACPARRSTQNVARSTRSPRRSNSSGSCPTTRPN